MSQLWPLSKSKILMHRQCPRWLWLETHRPDEKDDSETLQPGFSVGDQVGALARQTHANGALVDGARDFSSLCSLTREAMTQRVPVFEAAFEHKNVRVRTDLLLPLARSWHMAEVKSASEVKEHHIPDVAVQTAIIQKAGVRVSRASVRHIDKSFVYRGHGDYRGLLVDSDVNADV
jgi:hypothetical protein